MGAMATAGLTGLTQVRERRRSAHNITIGDGSSGSSPDLLCPESLRCELSASLLSPITCFDSLKYQRDNVNVWLIGRQAAKVSPHLQVLRQNRTAVRAPGCMCLDSGLLRGTELTETRCFDVGA